MFKENLTSKTESMTAKLEAVLDADIERRGLTVMDLLNDFDTKGTASMIVAYTRAYKAGKDVLLFQAKMMDEMMDDLKELKKMNENLCEQNKNMQAELLAALKNKG